MTAIEFLHRLAAQNVRGESIFERGDWDVCCILDGCRVDTFREFYPQAAAYRSRGSSSRNWIRRTFDDRDVSRVAYITANPFADELDADRFGYFHLEPVTDVGGIDTVAPATLRDRAIAVWNRREALNIERVVVHYMQPHVPFRARPDWFREWRGTDTWGSKAWRRVGDEVDRTEWFDAYRDNLAWVLAEGVEPLRDRVNARVAVTADHGNAAGEWALWGHPKGVATPEVRTVPWLEFQACQRVAVEPDVELDTERLDAEQRREQLKALGYA